MIAPVLRHHDLHGAPISMGEFASMTLICVVVVWVLATLREWLSPWVSEYGNNWRQPPTLGEVLRSQWQWFVALVKTGRVPR